MRAEYINPFVEGSIKVLQNLLATQAERGSITARPQIFTTQQINIVCGVTGDIEGQAIYGMPITAADKIASRMLKTPIITFDQLAASAITELGNMISGNSATLLNEAGFYVKISPPVILRGTKVQVSTNSVPAIVIPLLLHEIGLFEINIGLRESQEINFDDLRAA